MSAYMRLLFIILAVSVVYSFNRNMQPMRNKATGVPSDLKPNIARQASVETALGMSTVSRPNKNKQRVHKKKGGEKAVSGVKAASTLNSEARGTGYKEFSRYPCLVLNSDYRPLSHLPLSLWSWQDSLRALFAGRAILVSAYDVSVRSVTEVYELPAIIALKSYHRNPMNTPTMSRKGIFLRDNYRCQYCDIQFSGDPAKLSLDHLVPRSRGGHLTWENTVTACMQCNFQKGAHGPEELSQIGMKLKRMPYVPTAAELQGRAKNLKRHQIQHVDWHDYL